MELVKAGIEDLDNILKVYEDIIAHTPKMDIYARWKKGLHPTEASIREYIEQGAMYLYTDGKDIAGVMAVTMEQGEDYNQIQWAITTKDDEVSVIHLLGISPAWQQKGIGMQMINRAILLVKDRGKKSLRLDALASNLPAQHMYLKKGFQYRGKQYLYAKNTGWTDFYFYEYILN